MKIHIHLEYAEEQITALSVADAVIRMCEEAMYYNIKPTTVAKAILLAIEGDDNGCVPQK